MSLERLRALVEGGELTPSSARRVRARLEAGLGLEEALQEERARLAREAAAFGLSPLIAPVGSGPGTVPPPSGAPAARPAGSSSAPAPETDVGALWRSLGSSSLLLHTERWQPDPSRPGVVLDLALGRELVVRRGRGEAARALRQEAQILARLDHPAIPPLLEFGLTPRQETVLATAPAPGETLAGRLAAGEGGPDLEAICLRALREVSLGLAHARQRGVEHLGLTTRNVVLGLHGETRVTGWANARLAPEPAQGVGGLGTLLEEVLAGGGPRELRSLARVARGPGADYEDFAEDLRRYLAGEELRSHRYGVGAKAARWLGARPRGVVVFGLASVLTLGSVSSWAALRARQRQAEAERGVAEARAREAEEERAREAAAGRDSAQQAALTRARIVAAGEARSVIERDLAEDRLRRVLEPLSSADEAQLRLEGARLLVLGRSHQAARPLLEALGREVDLEVRVGALLLLHVIDLDRSGQESWPDSPALRAALEGGSGGADPLGLAPYARALEELQSGSREAALEALAGYRPQSRWHYPGLLLRARLRRELQGDLALADEEARAAANLAPGDYSLPALFELATISDARGSTRQARGRRDSILSAAGQAGKLARLGIQAIRAGHNERAEERLRRALQLDRRLGFLRVTLAEALLRDNQRNAEGVALLERATEELPYPYDAHLALAEQRLIEGSFEQAESHLQRALRIAPQLPKAYFLWGHLHARRGNRAAAVEALEKCLSLNPPSNLAAPARDRLRRLR